MLVDQGLAPEKGIVLLRVKILVAEAADKVVVIEMIFRFVIKDEKVFLRMMVDMVPKLSCSSFDRIFGCISAYLAIWA